MARLLLQKSTNAPLGIFAKLLVAIVFLGVVPVFAETDSLSEYPNNAYGKKIIFDAAKCSQNPHGMTHVAIGKTVFKHPSNYIYTTNSDVHANDITEPLYNAPHPSDPIGCPGNPIQGLGAGYILYFPDIMGNLSEHGGVSISYLGSPPEDSEYVMNSEKLFDLVCKKHIFDDNLEGFNGCTTSNKPGETDITKVYKASNYLTPSGRRFILECEFSQFQAARGCHVRYKLKDGIELVYSFTPQLDLIVKTLKADKAMRQKLQAEEVKNYPWAASTTDKTAER